MIDFLKSWVFSIVTLAVFLVLIEILLPSGKIKKFVNLICGFILIIAIINPVLGYFNRGLDFKGIQFSDSNFIDKKEIEQSSKVLEESQMKQIVGVYREKIIKQIEEAAGDVKGVSSVKADIIINEDYNSDKFGEIKQVYLYIAAEEKKSGIKPVTKVETVEKVDVNQKADSQKNDSEKKDKKDVDSVIKGEIEKKLNKLLDIQKENIVMSAT